MQGRVFKISSVACLAFMAVAFGNEARLDEVEVTSNSMGVDENKISVRNANLIKDVLRDIPGVYVGGTNGANQKIYMRGISDRGLNITIDGARQAGNSFHHNADLLIDPDIIKAVDVDVGGLSVVNSTGSLGSSVAFKTIDAADLLDDSQIIGAKLKLGYASNDRSFSKGGLIYTQWRGLDALFGFKHQSHRRGKAGNDKSIGGNGIDTNYLAKLVFSFLDAHKISLSTERQQYGGNYPMRAEFNISERNPFTAQNYTRQTHTLRYDYAPFDLLNLSINAYLTDHLRRAGGTKWGSKNKWS